MIVAAVPLAVLPADVRIRRQALSGDPSWWLTALSVH
jgi:hypothetical protein